jgi:class 3 adenylate cyclase/rhodanese-related sulfurtransferase
MAHAATFLFSDIEGSTRQWEERPVAMEAALARHDALVFEAVVAAGGEVFKHTGDGVCAVFAVADAAVWAGVQAQQLLAEEEWGDLGVLKVRVALHTGEAAPRGGDYFGPALNRTARLLAAAYGGQVLVTAATASAVSAGPLEGVQFVDLGEHQLRGIAEPERVFQVTYPGLERDFPPLRTRGGPVGSRAAKDALFDAFASVSRALASGRRVEIVDLLAQSERSLEEVATAIGHNVESAGRQLRLLAGAGLLRSRRDGEKLVYGLAGDDVEELWAAVRGVAARRVAAIERLAADYLGEREGGGALDPVSCAELADWIRRGDVVVIDVRPEGEYRAGHVPGARSVPVDELQQRVSTLPKDAEIVAYCRGPYCVMADQAVRLLHDKGFQARRLAEGFPEWRRAGLPVESDTEPRG